MSLGVRKRCTKFGGDPQMSAGCIWSKNQFGGVFLMSRSRRRTWFWVGNGGLVGGCRGCVVGLVVMGGGLLVGQTLGQVEDGVDFFG